MTLYSFKDLTAAFTHPLVGIFTLVGGELGAGSITVSNATTHTVHSVASDGNVMVSFISGKNGEATIEMQQTCILHNFLLGWFNAVQTAADNGDITNWAAATLSMRNVVDGTSHTLTGVSPEKVPDKTYTGAGGNITWRLLAAEVNNQ